MRALPLLLLLPGVALAQAVPNGTFADSSAWTSSGVNGGYASFVTQGTQFSSVETTTGIVFPSPQYARNVRSSGPAPTNSVGILTSDTFVLTKPTVQWKQISERTGVNIVFRLLDGASAQLSTAGVTPSDGAWATQTFNASAWCGRTVRVEFRQNTLNAGSGWFTLIDDVTLTGSTCSDFVDTDRDGTCPAGRDLNADGDCADAGEQTTPYDCAEGDAGRGGLQAEVTGNDVDEDCDGAVVCWRDNDHDGYGSGTVTSADGDCADVGEARQAGDCDDGRAAARPGGTEVCAAGDEDCDGLQGDADPSVSDPGSWYADADRDGHGAGAVQRACVAPSGRVASSDDCDDGDPLRAPGLTEVCDAAARDEDCDGLADDADPSVTGRSVWYADADADGHGAGGPLLGCLAPPGAVVSSDDCDDADALRAPGLAEVCDPVDRDEDCDGLADDADDAPEGRASAWWDGDADGFGDPAIGESVCDPAPGWVPVDGDCDDARGDVSPLGIEVCAAGDEDCDGDEADDDDDVSDPAAWYLDLDGDGRGAGAALYACVAAPSAVPWPDDCDDGDPLRAPTLDEVCDADDRDEDCDGLADDADDAAIGRVTVWWDGDGDGAGDPGVWLEVCDPLPGWVDLSGDCDDGRDDAGPSAVETCAPGDEDCDGLEDDLDPDVTGAPAWYADADLDGFGDPADATYACVAPPGAVADARDCDDARADAHPGAAETCAPGDEDCDGLADDADPDVTGAPTWHRDLDDDGAGDPYAPVTACVRPPDAVAAAGDCDDTDAHVNPAAPERCDPADVDEDCDGRADDADGDALDPTTFYVDRDGDGWGDDAIGACDPGPGRVARDGDCDDAAPAVHPEAPEACAPPDADCDGLDGVDDPDAADVLLLRRDEDGDGWGAGEPLRTCAAGPGWADDGGDCDDGDAAVSPDAAELCAPGDEDCDGLEGDADPGVSDGSAWYADPDGDGWGAGPAVTACAAPADHVAVAGDCGPADPDVHPGAAEVCAPGDEDCDGLEGDADPDVTDPVDRWRDQDGDGWGSAPLPPACEVPPGAAARPGDCLDTDDQAHPGAEEVPADGVDQDCDGRELCWADVDADGAGSEVLVPTPRLDCDATGVSPTADDCDDADGSVHPGAPETPGAGVDQDCDGELTCVLDTDGDGFGNAGGQPIAATTDDCTGAGEAPTADDCDDLDGSVHPGAVDLPGDAIDQDCSGEYTCWADADGDGWGGDRAIPSADDACDAPGEAGDGGDCDDGDPTSFPGGEDLAGDNVDQDCDGRYTCGADVDGDGFGSTVATVTSVSPTCDEPGAALELTDCDDGDAAISPSGVDLPNDGVDQDCDGRYTCSADRDGDGWGSRLEQVEDDDPGCAGAADDALDCNDMDAAIHPGAEDAPGDAIDADCDGVDPEPEDTGEAPVDSDVETDVPEPEDTGSRPIGGTPDKDSPPTTSGCSCGQAGQPGLAGLLLAAALGRRRRR